MLNSLRATAAAPSQAERKDPAVGTVIPVYGHSEYVSEAIASAVAQQGVSNSIVLVVDGCRNLETYQRAYCWAAAHRNVAVLTKQNAGLSAARNSGIEYLRKTHPEIEFIYFLDADNSLAPASLKAAAQTLRDSPGDVAWAYPDIHTTGIFEENFCANQYSRLAHLNDNVCEAGSLIRAEVLWTSGARFDEKMRAGYEDWDFWLQLMQRGYKGVHCPQLRLQYRRRPASMLASSHAMSEELRSYIGTKHKSLFQPKHVLRLERDEAPRYLSYVVDDERFLLHHNPACPREVLSLEQCAERLRGHSDNLPAAEPVGETVCFTNSATYAALAKTGLAGALLHRIERLLSKGDSVVVVEITRHDQSRISIRELGDAEPTVNEFGHVYAMSRRILVEVLRDKSNDWIRQTIFGYSLGSAEEWTDGGPPVPADAHQSPPDGEGPRSLFGGLLRGLEHLWAGKRLAIGRPTPQAQAGQGPASAGKPSQIRPRSERRVKYLRVNIPSSFYVPFEIPGANAEEMLVAISRLRRAGFSGRPVGPDATPYVWGQVTPGTTAAAILKTLPPYNNSAAGERSIVAVTVPFSAFGGAEKVAHQIGRVLRDSGFYTQLVVAWDDGAGSSRLLPLAFDEIVPLALGSTGAWSGVAYLGTPTFESRAGEPASKGKLQELYSCLIGADVVINCHVPDVHALAPSLRRQGVMTIADLHCFDLTKTMRPVGHPYLAVAYEHGYDRVIVPSNDLKHKLLGLGVPGSKILLVRNSVGVPEELTIGKVAPPRKGREQGLRCLFVGRLDRQKGADRLVSIVRAVKSRDVDVSWTVVGGSVLNDQENETVLSTLASLGVVCKAPVHDEEELVEELSEADALILPSYWEGLPLIILEAMRLGVVPIATRVGGIAEVITDGVNGFTVPSDWRTEAALTEIVCRLAGMPRDEFERLRQQAAADAAGHKWSATAAPLIEAIEQHLEEQARRAGTEAGYSGGGRRDRALVEAAG